MSEKRINMTNAEKKRYAEILVKMPKTLTERRRSMSFFERNMYKTFQSVHFLAYIMIDLNSWIKKILV